MPVFETGLGEDVHVHERRFVTFGGVRVGSESDLSNLTFRREFAAAKPVDPEGRAGSRKVTKSLLELFRIVGQLRDLLLCQNRRDRVARVRASLAFVASDGDFFLNAGHIQFDLDVVGPGAQVQVFDRERREALSLDMQLELAGTEIAEIYLAEFAGGQ